MLRVGRPDADVEEGFLVSSTSKPTVDPDASADEDIRRSSNSMMSAGSCLTGIAFLPCLLPFAEAAAACAAAGSVFLFNVMIAVSGSSGVSDREAALSVPSGVNGAMLPELAAGCSDVTRVGELRETMIFRPPPERMAAEGLAAEAGGVESAAAAASPAGKFGLVGSTTSEEGEATRVEGRGVAGGCCCCCCSC